MVLHNLFFLVLSGAIFVALWPKVEVDLLLVLGAVYVAAVALLELVLMPRYVYGPLRLLLEADRATREGRRGQELIEESRIYGDELGQIMRSRNATVAELRRHEEELARALRRLIEQDRLASLGMLSASVAHEMNTPLSVLQGSIEKLMETAGDPQARERLARMLRVTGRLRKISAGLVDFARVRPQELSRVALRPAIEEAWALVAIDDKAAGVRFDNRVGEEAAAEGDADRLVQVFVNLLRNALEAAPASGRVWVSSRVVEERGGRWVEVDVEDDGPGIPPELLGSIFEAFVSTRLDARGTGLGLTVAEGIIHQHGGSIEAFNRPAGGARLRVRLPDKRGRPSELAG